VETGFLTLRELESADQTTLIKEIYRLNSNIDTLTTVLYVTQQALKEATGDPVVSD